DTSPKVFEKALNSWAVIDLPSLQKELDSKGLEIQNSQKESLMGRKELATKTKNWKKLPDDEKMGEINPLLKSYQNEIDVLTKKNKSIENGFFQVYRAIAEAPDPKPLLQLSLDAVNTLKDYERLKDEKNELEEKLLQYADYNQLKNMIVKTERELLKVNESKLQAKDDEWKSLLEEKDLNWRKKELEFANTISKFKKEIEEMKINEEMMKLRLKNQTKTLRKDITVDRTVNAIELQMLSRDAETSKVRILELEKRNEELRRGISLAKSDVEFNKVKEMNNKRINELESENALLIARLEHERRNVDSLKLDIKNKTESFNREFNSLNNEIDALRERNSATLDYDEIKKELEILKQIEFGDNDNSGDEAPQLESSIVQRNKKLNNEIIEFRSKNEDLTQKCEQLENQLRESITQIEKLKEMNNKLEMDLMNFESGAGSNNDKWETMSMISSIAPSMAQSSIRGKLSPASSIAGGFDPSQQTTLVSQQDSSILPIITQQRDRFRVRNKELEEESKKQFSKIVELKREANALKNDNRDLYERIRFLQFHQDSNNSKQSSTYNQERDLEKKYKETYESELHPIEQFRIMETKRINSRMSPFERIFIQLTKTVLSTKYTRLAFVVYCVGLHFVVMLLTVYLM
ncbi:hypothetical protein CANARDRAFT_189874, partial [[Candida] arabinofermentans NRRL YB-2248]